MHGEHAGPAQFPDAEEFLLPQRPHMSRRRDGLGPARAVEPEVRRVVEYPGDGYLDQRHGLEPVRLDVVHEIRGVRETVLMQQVQGVRAEIPRRRAVAGHLRAEPAQDLQAAEKLGLLLGTGQLAGRGVGVAVMGDLVPGRDDRVDAFRMPLGHASRDVKRGLHSVPGQHVQDQRDRDLGSVGALREDAGGVRVRRVLADPDFLGVEVEGERGSATCSVRPHGVGAPFFRLMAFRCA